VGTCDISSTTMTLIRKFVGKYGCGEPSATHKEIFSMWDGWSALAPDYIKRAPKPVTSIA
jgi:hypothetical protein